MSAQTRTRPAWAKHRLPVRENTVKKVDIVKVWVDDRNDKYDKLTPALYGAVIDEAHRSGLRVTAHIFELEDAKGYAPASMRLRTESATGMTPMQVIMAATRNAAEFLRLTDMGALEAGKSADFIVLDADPLDDITNTRRISSVYLRGIAVIREEYR